MLSNRIAIEVKLVAHPVGLATFFWPARSALLPQLIEPSSLFAANALYMVSDSGVRVIAPSLSAFILLRLGPPGVIAIDTASFVISAGSVCFLTTALLQPIKAVSPLRKRDFSAISVGSQENPSPRRIGVLMERAWWIHTPSLLLNLIFGAMTAATTVRLLTFLQLSVANHFLGRMLATYTAVQVLAQVVGMGVASIAVFPIGVMWFLMFNGALYLLGGGLAWILLTGDDDSP